ncbi:hypothetical protein KEK_12663 [Mycolicibacterium thermoresistibile ATCC 19527]|uniref:Uncharacterized protein n=1 Tax=Mycolicibacterium thermoresistibile (strain ATCC 19527 / DSM 44167 / CIP 105390 / JCM 6362 / NCTC 10409 / 316) TaxID=1078020 RepID=G7CKU3_MYCT3|nr:hypothetical protein KEK_12663 [Mycolicibacterium thermoresistibile ATCC 19527]
MRTRVCAGLGAAWLRCARPRAVSIAAARAGSESPADPGVTSPSSAPAAAVRRHHRRAGPGCDRARPVVGRGGDPAVDRWLNRG